MIDDPKLNLITTQDRANVARKRCPAAMGGFSEAVFFADRERLQLQFEKSIENRMELALRNREFVVYYQPKYDLATGRPAGAEALVRWNDPERGLLPPAQFIPLFEKNGFITKLDLYVFDEVCRTLREWRARGLEMTVSVNVSQVHFSNPNFLDRYIELFSGYDVPAELLELEFTETLVFENLERLMGAVDRIHAAGFLCSLDDFGSGYSSLNMLKDVRVDTLKLDRIFFNRINAHDERAERIIESVIELAKKLKMLTVSEGVETAEQVAFLKAAGCDMAQGYYFAKPLPREAFERLIFMHLVGRTHE